MTTKILCDAPNCRKNLAITRKTEEHFLALVSVQKRSLANDEPGDGPKTDRDLHFCGLQCLQKWMDRRV